jgi:hypothetical protein
VKTKGKVKEKLWLRIGVVGAQLTTGIDFPVSQETTIKKFTDLEEALNNIFEGVKFDLDFHWEKVDG